MFELPLDVRGLIWSRARFLQARTALHQKLQRRPKPCTSFYLCHYVILVITDAKRMRIWSGWSTRELLSTCQIFRSVFPVRVFLETSKSDYVKVFVDDRVLEDIAWGPSV